MDPAKHFPLIILFPVGHQRLRMSCIVFSWYQDPEPNEFFTLPVKIFLNMWEW